MAKEKIYHETLVNKCTNYNCMYNKGCFCELCEVILGEDGTCIYRREIKSK